MAYVVKMPKLGMEMQSGELLEWFVDRGDDVSEGDVIAEIESEKSTAEVTAREDGVLRRVLLEPGSEVEPGTAMGIVAGPDEEISALLDGVEGVTDEGTETTETPETSVETPSSPTASGESDRDDSGGVVELKVSPRARKRADELDVDLPDVEGTGVEGAVVEADIERAAQVRTADADTASTGESAGQTSDVRATPKAKKLTREIDVDLETVEGTGPQDAVTASDVRGANGDTNADTASGAGSATAEKAAQGTDRTVREARQLSGMRRTIASRLGESYRNAAHVTVNRNVDVEELLSAKDVADRTLEAEVSLSDVLLVCLSASLDEHPEFNATYEDDTHYLYDEQNVGVAVDVDNGLITPVVGDIGGKSLDEIAAERRRLMNLALSGEYTMDDLSGGTFTVTNLGVFGVDSFTPIINPPQVAILGVNRVREEPTRGENGVEFCSQMQFDLSFDHRVVDGADAARFLQTLAEHVRDPWGLLLQRT
jgi:pyruvate dehydrogenase E2 component (dihydrolipoamide acetyltransferase)